MVDPHEAFRINRETWNQKTPHHFNSKFYDSEAFAQNPDSLNGYEIEALGDVSGKSLLHLQCHFGQDTISWSKRGARCTGLDFSDQAIATAKRLAVELDVDCAFVCHNVLEAASEIDDTFDIVFTSYGVIGWLNDLGAWARQISVLLRPGGCFYIIEFHPVLWMFDWRVKPPALKYRYRCEAEVYEEYQGTYADQDAQMTSREFTWNHGLSDVVQALIDHGLQIEKFAEHDASPYDVFPGLVKGADGLFRFERPLYPLLFEILAVKPTASAT